MYIYKTIERRYMPVKPQKICELNKLLHRVKQMPKRAVRTLTSHYIKQKIYGIISVVLAFVVPFLVDGDATASLIFFPLGLYFIFAKEENK